MIDRQRIVRRPTLFAVGFASICLSIGGCTAPSGTTVSQLCQSSAPVSAVAGSESCLTKDGPNSLKIEVQIEQREKLETYAARLDRLFLRNLRTHKTLLDHYLAGVRPNGSVVIEFTVLADGAVSGAAIYRSSGSRLADDAGITLVLLGSPYPPTPDARPVTIVEAFKFVPRKALFVQGYSRRLTSG